MLGSLFTKIKKGLAKTRGVFTGVVDLFRGRGKVDQAFLAELEKKLYLADVGGYAVAVIVDRVRQAYQDKEVTDDVLAFVKAQLRDMLSDPSSGIGYVPAGPTVVMIVGVNGSGKTTTIAKLAHRLKADGKKVLVAACDTFRAAAVEQLTVWCQRIGCEIAKARGFDVVIVDTAGRLHTQAHLMRELEKIYKVVTRQVPGAPHETLMVLDATTGQNAVTQAEMFSKSVKCSGIVLTKLDGTAKGGAIFAIKQKVGLPVKYVGVGEGVEDLEPFDPNAYVEALFVC